MNASPSSNVVNRLPGMVRLDGNVHLPSYPDGGRPAYEDQRAVMPAVFLDRDGRAPDVEVPRISTLLELPALVELAD